MQAGDRDGLTEGGQEDRRIATKPVFDFEAVLVLWSVVLTLSPWSARQVDGKASVAAPATARDEVQEARLIRARPPCRRPWTAGPAAGETPGRRGAGSMRGWVVSCRPPTDEGQGPKGDPCTQRRRRHGHCGRPKDQVPQPGGVAGLIGRNESPACFTEIQESGAPRPRVDGAAALRAYNPATRGDTRQSHLGSTPGVTRSTTKPQDDDGRRISASSLARVHSTPRSVRP